MINYKGTYMIDQSKYTQTQAKRSLKTVRNQQGDELSSTYVTTEVWKKRLVKTQGMNMCKKKSLFPILAETIKSNLEMRIVSYLLENQGKKSYVRNSNNEPVTIQQVASKFTTSERKVRGLLKELEDADLVKRFSKRIYINPYIQLPFGNTQEANYIAQLMWTHSYEYTEEQLIESHSTELTVDRTVEV